MGELLVTEQSGLEVDESLSWKCCDPDLLLLEHKVQEELGLESVVAAAAARYHIPRRVRALAAFVPITSEDGQSAPVHSCWTIPASSNSLWHATVLPRQNPEMLRLIRYKEKRKNLRTDSKIAC